MSHVLTILLLSSAAHGFNDGCDEVAVESEVRQCQASGHSRVNIVEAGASAQVFNAKNSSERLTKVIISQPILCDNLAVTMECMDIWLSCYGPAQVEQMKLETVEDGLSEFDSLPAFLTNGIDLRKCEAVEDRGL